eukprot:6052211-Amphidinium_carterae.1
MKRSPKHMFGMGLPAKSFASGCSATWRACGCVLMLGLSRWREVAGIGARCNKPCLGCGMSILSLPWPPHERLLRGGNLFT